MSGSRKLLNTAQAAQRVCLSERTLERLRVSGGGPRFKKLGRWVRYTVADLEAWIESRSRSSTSDDGDGDGDGDGEAGD